MLEFAPLTAALFRLIIPVLSPPVAEYVTDVAFAPAAVVELIPRLKVLLAPTWLTLTDMLSPLIKAASVVEPGTPSRIPLTVFPAPS